MEEYSLSESGNEIATWQVYEYNNGCLCQCILSLYDTETIIENSQNFKVKFSNSDIIGAKIIESKGELCHIEISTMPIEIEEGSQRKLYAFNYWANDNQKARDIVGSFWDIYLGNIPKEKYHQLPRKQTNFLVLINPFACAGKALKNWVTLKETLSKFYIDFEEKETEFAGYAKDLMMNGDLSMYTGVVTVSGDGLIHEVINGLMLRKDRSHIPTVGCLPGGTSDAFIKSILEEQNIALTNENILYVLGMGATK